MAKLFIIIAVLGVFALISRSRSVLKRSTSSGKSEDKGGGVDSPVFFNQPDLEQASETDLSDGGECSGGDGGSGDCGGEG